MRRRAAALAVGFVLAAGSSWLAATPAFAAAPQGQGKPQLSGPTTIDDSLQATTGSWDQSGLDYSYEWFACDPGGSNCSSIAGASGPSYQLDPFDGGSAIEVAVTATNADGESATQTSAPTAAVRARPGAPSALADPVLDGESGSATRTGSDGNWSADPTSFEYFWVRCLPDGSSCDAVGDDQPSYTPTPADDGDYLLLAVVASNAVGDSEPAFSAPSLPVSFAPPPTITITAPADGGHYPYSPFASLTASYSCSPGDGSVTVMSCRGDVANGTQLLLLPYQGDFRVTATDSDGQQATTSASYTVGVPLAVTISSPSVPHVAQNTPLTAAFSCAGNPGATVSCTATQGVACTRTLPLGSPTQGGAPADPCPETPVSPGGTLDTSVLGEHVVTVTATESLAVFSGSVFSNDPVTRIAAYYVTRPVVSLAPPVPETLAVGGLTISATKLRRGGGPVTIAFDSNLAAQVSLSFRRAVPGRRVHGKCVGVTPANRRARPCTRERSFGTIVADEQPGADSISFRGVVGGRRLPPGKYTVVVTAVPEAGASAAADQVGMLHVTVSR